MTAFINKISWSACTFVLLFSAHSALTQTRQVVDAQIAVNKVLDDSGKEFKQGLFYLKENKRHEAAERFDRSVETFLLSTLNIQSNQRLQACYTNLIETVYRMEFPSETQVPQLRGLTAACGWNWNDNELKIADEVALMLRPAARSSQTPNNVAVNTAGGVQDLPGDIAELSQGFNSQAFEPSPLDELAKLELTAEEQVVEGNPETQQQYEYIQYAVANRSLGFSFQVHPMIQQYINYYRGRGRRTMETGLYRSGMFMSMARRIFREEGLPENIAWLGQVESAWKPVAVSHMSASGLWQFMPATGQRFGLRRTAHIDERNSFEEATRASAKYLKWLANRYGGNWELAMAAYNCGEGNTDKAIRRAGGQVNFWAAYPYLPRETRNYVPNILATILIANNPQKYGFGHVRPAPALRYDRVRVPASTNLRLIAQASDTTVQYLRYLNPHLRTNNTPPEPYVINVPAGRANDVVAVFRRVPAARINETNLATSVQGETWQTISNRTGVSVTDLMAANPGMKNPTGKVFVPMDAVAGNRVTTTSYSRPANSNAAAANSNIKIVKARAGDTVAKVAERNGANASEVAKFNGLLPNSVLGAGREIRIPLSSN